MKLPLFHLGHISKPKMFVQLSKENFEVNMTHHVKTDLMGIAKSIDPRQPAQFA